MCDAATPRASPGSSKLSESVLARNSNTPPASPTFMLTVACVSLLVRRARSEST